MKKLISKMAASVTVLLIFVIFTASAVLADGIQYTENTGGHTIAIVDDAGLLQGSDRDSIVESMRPITQYCSVLLLTTDNNNMSLQDYAWQRGSSVFGSSESFTVFMIDMDNRQLYIGSTSDIRKTLSTARANTITDNVYRYASNGDYAACARTAFEQMVTILDGGNIPAPMKIIGCVLIALIGGLTVCYMIMSGAGKVKPAGVHEIETGMGRNEITVSNVRRKRLSSVFVAASKGGGGSSGGGGGGGFSGGGGGGGFGGGSHGF